jgi:TRAP-type mannitol/chloroaromatic compound transport system substrate-binding protein
MSARRKAKRIRISRRHFARLAAVAGAAAAARPAIAQPTTETVKWRLTSSLPRNLDTLFGAAVEYGQTYTGYYIGRGRR